jgi:hypothetical protein
MELEMFTDIPEMNMDDSETGCCPKFDPTHWDRKVMKLENLRMVKASTRSFIYIPLNMGRVMTKTMKAITNAEADCKDKYLILSQDQSRWRCDHYILVDKEVPGLNNVLFSGTFITMVFEGDYSQIPNWMPLLETQIKEKSAQMKSVYAFYTTCPKCAKHYGKNYVVLFGEI